MHLGVRLTYQAPDLSSDHVRKVAIAAEEAGFRSLWVGDHLVFPAGPSDTKNPTTTSGRYPRSYDMTTLESLTTLAYAAGATGRIALAVGVCIVPYRNPLILAKQLATLSHLTDGRLIFGAGLGWLSEEFMALGVPFAERRDRLEDGIRLIRSAMSCEGVLDYQGSTFTTSGPMHFQPAVGEEAFPILIGGHSDPALARAVRLGDGWFGHNIEPDQVPGFRRQLLAEADGSLPKRFEVVASRVLDVVGADAGNPDVLAVESGRELADLFDRYSRSGLDTLVCDVRVGSYDAVMPLIGLAVDAAGLSQDVVMTSS